jgi:hypothetical protein
MLSLEDVKYQSRRSFAFRRRIVVTPIVSLPQSLVSDAFSSSSRRVGGNRITAGGPISSIGGIPRVVRAIVRVRATRPLQFAIIRRGVFVAIIIASVHPASAFFDVAFLHSFFIFFAISSSSGGVGGSGVVCDDDDDILVLPVAIEPSSH